MLSTSLMQRSFLQTEPHLSKRSLETSALLWLLERRPIHVDRIRSSTFTLVSRDQRVPDKHGDPRCRCSFSAALAPSVWSVASHADAVASLHEPIDWKAMKRNVPRLALATIVGLVSLVLPIPGMLGASLVFRQGIVGDHGIAWLVLSYCLNFALFFGIAYVILGFFSRFGNLN